MTYICVSGDFSDNKFFDIEFSRTDLPTPNYPKQVFRQLHFPTGKFSEKFIYILNINTYNALY